MKKTTKILDAFFNNKTVKYLAIYCVALLIFYIIGDFINSFKSNKNPNFPLM